MRPPAGALACVPRGTAMNLPLCHLLLEPVCMAPAACSRNWLAAADQYASPTMRQPLIKRLPRKFKVKGPRR